MKRILSFVLVICFVFSNGVGVLGVDTNYAETPHYYVTSLNEFMASEGRDKTAVLHDLDGDGFEEMIACKDIGDAESREGSFTIYDIENGENLSVSYDFYWAEKLYISDTNYIIVDSFETGGGSAWEAISYSNGKLSASEIFSDAEGYYFDIDANYSTDNGIQITETEFNQYYDEYGVGDINKLLYKSAERSDLQQPISNDIEEIKALSSTNTTTAISPPKVIFNGKDLNFTLPIINQNNRTFYPMRELLESLGAAVVWDDATSTATGELNGNKVEFTIGSNKYKVNGTTKSMDEGVTPFIEDGRTYIPIRYAAEGLGFTVTWDDATNTINIK